ncbi:hypothetical protein NE683_12270 [Bariatricus massiliensis]|uniref:RNA polymerase sigma-70 region 4 domain-containing protein n=1 Tax=Bariatricus massiliensis TaxID=1745713 RepID=A0ABS8DH11_9FIRM|nr:hypothetical protein [Bariatricus massiliensis]MCB7306170.1 hypothetical protein [Bariatricus massiliensis]MCB7375248.1 hypothetical protein [Bariatricus massiliensis]MCB7387708.1 hypothetical protein [Bariatricus massiliensis]MCB7411869.1 hypothetical protein [Bariatricus massiliensis]MCQ5254006.1 hypothetical protein [Bariatricus massiliensis]
MTQDEKEAEIQKLKEEKIQKLDEYRLAVQQCKTAAMKIQLARVNKMFPSLVLDNMPKGNSVGDLSDYSVRLDELTENLKKELKRKGEIKKEIMKKIADIPIQRGQEAIRLKYIEFHSFGKISKEIGVSYRQVLRIHEKALEFLEFN